MLAWLRPSATALNDSAPPACSSAMIGASVCRPGSRAFTQRLGSQLARLCGWRRAAIPAQLCPLALSGSESFLRPRRIPETNKPASLQRVNLQRDREMEIQSSASLNSTSKRSYSTSNMGLAPITALACCTKRPGTTIAVTVHHVGPVESQYSNLNCRSADDI